jgi:acyl phosphate:glycerol-3-phosphate acyltransferase
VSPDPLLMLAGALAGYLIGAISFARILASRADGMADLAPVSRQVPGTNVTFVMDTVSATTVNAHVSKKLGCITALLDMAKVMIPTLIARFTFPGQPYDLVVAAFGVLGHNWPVYYRFRGGRGESAIIGGILAIDPLGLLAVNAIAAVAGIILGSMLVLRWAGFLLLIPWQWYTTHDIGRVTYVAAVLLMYVVALRSELGQYLRLKRDRVPLSQEVIAETISMGKPLGRFMDRYSFFALWRRWRHPEAKEVPHKSSGHSMLLLIGLLAGSWAAADGTSAQTLLFEGQASLLEQLCTTTPCLITSDLRCLPVLSARTPLDEERELSGELSAHLGYRMINEADQRARFEHTAWSGQVSRPFPKERDEPYPDEVGTVVNLQRRAK